MGCLVGQSHKRPFGNLSNIILKKKLNFVQGRKLNVTTFSNFLSYKYVYNISMNIQYVILGCVLVLFILLATGLSCGALPYSSTATYTKYEGFRKSTFHDKLRTLYRQLNRQEKTKEFYADELRLIRKAINERDYNAEAVVDAVRRISEKTKGIKGRPRTGDSVARQLTRDFLNWYDEAHIIIKTNDNIEASEEATAKAAAAAEEIRDANAASTAAALARAQALAAPPPMTAVTPTAVAPTPQTSTASTVVAPTPQTSTVPTTTISGFTTISASEYKSSEIIDRFSSATGSITCSKMSSGLTNSLGPLCLSKEQLYLLQSRGGNSSGRDSQIGA